MKKIELVWRRDCPYIAEARTHLMRALSEAGMPARWREWCVDDEDCPSALRQCASPTVLIDGRDPFDRARRERGCHTYDRGDGYRPGAPSVPMLSAALRGVSAGQAKAPKAGISWRRAFAMLPSIGVGLLPKLACPACWPAYAGLLSSFGVSFLIDSRYLFALTAIFLVVALFFLGFRASRRRGLGPLAIGVVASVVLLVGKFHFGSDTAMFLGVGLLMGASFWNSWPRKLATSPACAACEPSASVSR